MFKTETIFPLIEVSENLRANTVSSISSLINVYNEIELMIGENTAFMDTSQLLKSKLIALIGKITSQQTKAIFIELTIGSIESLDNADMEQLEQLIKRLYEIIFKYKSSEEAQVANIKLLIKSQEIKKQISDQVAQVILNVYEAACKNLKKWNSKLEIYDVATIKKSLC